MEPPEAFERGPGANHEPPTGRLRPQAQYRNADDQKVAPPRVGGRASGGDHSLAERDTIAQQLRRRREAAMRLPPLSDGRPDLWDLESYYDPARGA
jgi:hypothetical protein